MVTGGHQKSFTIKIKHIHVLNRASSQKCHVLIKNECTVTLKEYNTGRQIPMLQSQSVTKSGISKNGIAKCDITHHLTEN